MNRIAVTCNSARAERKHALSVRVGKIFPNAGGTADMTDYPSRNIGDYVPGLFGFSKYAWQSE